MENMNLIVKKSYEEEKRSIIYNNLIFATKIFLLSHIILYVTLISIDISFLQSNFMIIAFCYFIQYPILICAIKLKLIGVDYIGCFIYLFTNLLFIYSDYESKQLQSFQIGSVDIINNNSSNNNDNKFYYFFYSKGTTQFVNVISTMFIMDIKKEITCKVIQHVCYYHCKIYFFNVNMDAAEQIDCVIDVIYFVLLSYLINKINYEKFAASQIEMEKAFQQLSIGMDKLSENIMLLNVSDIQNIKIKYASSNFKDNFILASNINQVQIKELFSKFISFDFNNNNKNSNSSNNLYDDFYSFLINKYSSNVIITDNNSNDIIKSNKYYENQNKQFEVKIVYYVQQRTSTTEELVLIKFDNIQQEKVQQIYNKVTKQRFQIIKIFIEQLLFTFNCISPSFDLLKSISKDSQIANYKYFTETKNKLSEIAFNDKSSEIEIIITKEEQEKEILKEQINYIDEMLQINTHYQLLIISNYKFIKYHNYKLKCILDVFLCYIKIENKESFEMGKSIINIYSVITSLQKYNLFQNIVCNESTQKLSKNYYLNVNLNNFDLLLVVIQLLLQEFSNNFKNLFFLLKQEQEDSNNNNHLIVLEFQTFYEINNNNDTTTNNITTHSCDLLLTELDMYRDIIKKLQIINNVKLNEIVDPVNKTITISLIIESFIRIPIDVDNYDNISSNNMLQSSNENVNINSINKNDNNSNDSYTYSLNSSNITHKLSNINFSVKDAYNLKLLYNSNNNYNFDDVENTLEQIQNIFIVEETNGITSEENNDNNIVDCNNRYCLCFNTLIVDDDLLSINCSMSIISKYNSNRIIETACNGQIAFDKINKLIESNCNCKNNKNILILMDVHMPVMNGIESAKKISEILSKTNYNLNTIRYRCKILFISANIESQFGSKLEEIPEYFGYVSKPITRMNLLQFIKIN